MNMNKLYTILGTWSRAFIAAVIASYLSGNSDPKVIAASGLAAVLPVILRYLNPNDVFPEKH
jgi:hypothetical protein